MSDTAAPRPSSQTPTPPLVSVIVVNYKTRDMTLEALRSLERETQAPHEVIVVDNASGDGLAEAVAAEFPHFRMMAETENHGFAKANNLAARHASGEYILLLNPDTVILDGAVDRLLAFARQRPEAMIWGGRTLYGDRSLNPTCCWRRMTFWNVFCRSTGLSGVFRKSEFFNSEAYGGWQRDCEREVDIICGAFMLMKRTTWETLGGFDLGFVMYGEEADLCLRARKDLGARPRMTPAAEIIHYVGASEQVKSGKIVMILNAKTLMIRRHFPAWQQGLALWTFRAWPLSRYLGARLRKGGGAWQEAWTRRAEWWNGYRPASPQAKA